MACVVCLVPSHYPKEWLVIVENINRTTNISMQENAFKNFVFEMSAILSLKYVNVTEG